MNIHEHQAKQLLKKFGAIVPNGEACFTVQEVLEKAKKLNLKKNWKGIIIGSFPTASSPFLKNKNFGQQVLNNGKNDLIADKKVNF